MSNSALQKKLEAQRIAAVEDDPHGQLAPLKKATPPKENPKLLDPPTSKLYVTIPKDIAHRLDDAVYQKRRGDRKLRIDKSIIASEALTAWLDKEGFK